MMMQSAGSWYVKEDGKTVDIADNEVLKESVKTYQQIIDAGIAEQIFRLGSVRRCIPEG